MTPLLLIDELKGFLEEIAETYALETGKGSQKTPQVVEGWLPPKESQDVPDIPYIIIRLTEGEDTSETARATVKILIGTYSEDPDGWKDSMNVLLRIRERLLVVRTIGNKFRVELPLKWKLFEEQPYPIWIGEVNTIWTVALPIEQVKEDDYVYYEE